MAPFRLLVALLLILALALGGCAGRTAPTVSSTTASGGLVPVDGGSSENGTAPGGPQPSAATRNLTKDPVGIQEEGELSSGIDKEWTWHVAPGFKSFTVALSFGGLQDAPLYTVANVAYDLTGGDPSQTWATQGGGFQSGSAGCEVCLDGAELEGVAGQWRFQFSTAPSAAEYSLHIQVTY